MKLSFDPAKRVATLAARGLDFTDAVRVFAGPAINMRDDRFDYGEDRWITIGYLDRRMIIVVWIERDGDRRIISMRKPMSESNKIMDINWTDPDDAPELDEHFFQHGQITRCDVVIREATDTMARRGRPPKGEQPKVNQTLRLSQDVLA